MTQILRLHPDNPQKRLLEQAAALLKQGGLIVYPTDSVYALGTCLGHKKAVDRIRQIRQLDKHHNFTLVCSNLSELGTYARVDNSAYRLIRAHTPGPYTFILKAATDYIPRLLFHPKHRSMGLRVPQCPITQSLLELLGEPLLSSTLILPGENNPLSDMEEIEYNMSGKVDLILDGGSCGLEPTTVISFLSGTPEVMREGKGDISAFT